MRSRNYQFHKEASYFLEHHIYLISLAISFILFFIPSLVQWNGDYVDPDNFMRAIRLKHFIQTPSFWEQPISESNYPFGEVIHWTRPMDILWLICYTPFSFFMPVKDAIVISGAFLNPLIKMATSIALVYGIKHHFNVMFTLLALLFFLYYPAGRFSPEAPDHHSLMILWLMIAISLILHWFKNKKNKHLTWLGIILALSVWTAVEGFLLYFLILMFFIYRYVFNNNLLSPACKMAKSFAFALTCCWLLNPPYEGWFYPDNGRISVLFVCLSWMCFIGLKFIEKVKLHKCKTKILALLGTAICVILLMIALFSTHIFVNPLTPELTKIWTLHIKEMHPIYNTPLPLQLEICSMPIILLLINIYLLHIKYCKPLMLFNLCIGIPLFILTLYARRFECYLCICWILPFTAFIKYLYSKYPHSLNFQKDLPIYIWGILILFTCQTFIHILLYFNSNHPDKSKDFSYSLCQQIRNIGGTLVTNTSQGPKYIWKCNVNTVATPYHRNTEGIIDNYQILSGTDDNIIIPLLRKHQITQIVIFDQYQKEFDEKNKNILYNRLRRHQDIPPYLEEILIDLNTAHYYHVKI